MPRFERLQHCSNDIENAFNRKEKREKRESKCVMSDKEIELYLKTLDEGLKAAERQMLEEETLYNESVTIERLRTIRL